MAVTTVCRTRTFVSCDRGERRLEFRCCGNATMDAGGMTTAGRPWGWRSYQRVRGAEAIVVVKRTIWRCSSCAAIPRRSCACGRQDSAEDRHVDLERMVIGKYVKEVHKDDREVLAQSRG
jgi:hypothetical protein